MTIPASDPGLPGTPAITSGASWPKPLEKTCGPACIAGPLYVLLNLESRRPLDALKGLWSALGEHSGHTTVYLVLSAPSVMEGRLFLELHGLWKDGLLQSSFPGLANPAFYHPDWTTSGLDKKRLEKSLGSNKGKRTKKDRGGDPVQAGSDTQQPEQVDTGQRLDWTQALRIPSEEDRRAWGLQRGT
jgi:hypothetical protein